MHSTEGSSNNVHVQPCFVLDRSHVHVATCTCICDDRQWNIKSGVEQKAVHGCLSTLLVTHFLRLRPQSAHMSNTTMSCWHFSSTFTNTALKEGKWGKERNENWYIHEKLPSTYMYMCTCYDIHRYESTYCTYWTVTNISKGISEEWRACTFTCVTVKYTGDTEVNNERICCVGERQSVIRTCILETSNEQLHHVHVHMHVNIHVQCTTPESGTSSNIHTSL